MQIKKAHKSKTHKKCFLLWQPEVSKIWSEGEIIADLRRKCGRFSLSVGFLIFFIIYFIFFIFFIDKLSSSSSPNQILVRSWGEQSHNMVLPGRRRWAWWALTTGQISVWSFLRGKCLHFGKAEALFGKHWQVLHLSIGGTPLPTFWQFLGCAQKIMKEATLANFVSVASHCAKNIKLDHCIYILPKLS